MMQEHLDTGRPFHYTAPVGMVLGFREALQVIAEEGLAAVWARHRRAAERLWAGLQVRALASAACVVPCCGAGLCSLVQW